MDTPFLLTGISTSSLTKRQTDRTPGRQEKTDKKEVSDDKKDWSFAQARHLRHGQEPRTCLEHHGATGSAPENDERRAFEGAESSRGRSEGYRGLKTV